MTEANSSKYLGVEKELEEATEIDFWKAEVETKEGLVGIGLPCSIIVKAVLKNKKPFGKIYDFSGQIRLLLEYLERGSEVMGKLQKTLTRFENPLSLKERIFQQIELMRFIQSANGKLESLDRVGLCMLRCFIPDSVLRQDDFLSIENCLYKFNPMKDPPVYVLKEATTGRGIGLVFSFLVADPLSIIEHFPDNIPFVDLAEMFSPAINQTRFTRPAGNPKLN